MSNEKFNLEAWENFSASSSSETLVSGAELFKSYLSLKSHFNKLPKAELVKRNWIKNKDDLSSLVDFFRDVHSNSNNALFRKANDAEATLYRLWISEARSRAEINVLAKKIPEFTGITKDYLREIALLSENTNVLKELPELLAKQGIVLVFLRSLPSMKLDGAVFQISSGHPVIAMSLRYARLDNFWFTLLHELAHIHLHIENLSSPILEDFDIHSDDIIEISANRLAKNSLITRQEWRTCDAKYNRTTDSITSFAKHIGVHKAIVAGMLARESGNYAPFAEILNEINVREVIFGDG